MVLNYNQDHILTKRVDEEQLEFLAENLVKFREVYLNNIYVMDDPEMLDALAKIDHIRYLIQTRQYGELFEDPNIVMTKHEMNEFN